MKSISMLELRTGGKALTKRLQSGETLALTYRGKTVATLVPAERGLGQPMPADEPFRALADLAETGLGPMTSDDIDQLLYGHR